MMNNATFDFSQQAFGFELALYVSDRDGRINLYFTSSTGNDFLFFDSVSFSIKPIASLPPLAALHSLTCVDPLIRPQQITGIRCNGSGHIYLLLNDTRLMKIYFAPDDVYASRCVQLVTMIVPLSSRLHYQDAMEDYLNHSQPLCPIYD